MAADAITPCVDDDSVESCAFPQLTTSFSSWENLTLSDTQEIARALKLIARKFGSFALSKESLQHDISADFLEAVSFYSALTPGFGPGHLLSAPAATPRVCVSAPHKLSTGSVFDVTFRSSYNPLYPPFRVEFSSYEENRTVHARIWKHEDAVSRGCVVAIHGWFMGDQRVNALALVPGFFFRLGLDVAVVELPYHGRRAPKGADPLKALFPSLHLPRTNEGVAQAVHDLHALKLWLEGEYGVSVGVTGMSLGGYVAALWASLDKLAFAIPMVPLVMMDEIGWRVVEKQRESCESKDKELWDKIDRDLLKQIFAAHCPLNFAPRVSPERRMIIAAEGDEMVPSIQAQALWEHWGRPKMHWFRGGHLGELPESDAFKQVHAFLASHGLAYPELLDMGSK